MATPLSRAGIARTAIAFIALALAPLARAAGAGFSEGLSREDRAACGIQRLAPRQLAALDALVGRDVTIAHQGGVTGFSSPFTARLTAQERASAGIDLLSRGERPVLDSLVARAIALGPPPSEAFSYAPPPGPPPPAPVITLAPAPRLDLHGDVSVTIGGGSHGSSFYGTSLDLYATDPSGKFTVGIGFSEYRARGPIGLYGPYCPLLFEPPYVGW
jgi:hypothetical protein